MTSQSSSTPVGGGLGGGQPPQIRVEMRSNPLYLSGAREMVSAVARRLGFPDDACGQIALAVDEALCNVIRHGYQRDPNRPIWLSLFPLHDPATNPTIHDGPTTALKIIIEDEAAQIDPSQIKSRDLEEVRPGGLGVHIIKTVMDEVVYERRERTGMRLTMIKRRAGKTPDAAPGAESAGGASGGGSGASGDGTAGGTGARAHA